ncbi:MAG TPA: hypothetical protein VF773_23340 [Verrucomicrobiae bacterium]
MWRALQILVLCFAAAAQPTAPIAIKGPSNATAVESGTKPAIEDAEITSAQSPNGEIIITNTPYKIPENQILQFPVQVTKEARLALAAKNQVIDYVKAAIAVPRNFDPDLPYPVLLISGSSDGDGSSIRMLPAYTNIALRLGWVVIAADGPHGKPVLDTPAWRWALASSLLDHMHKSWPKSRRWPIAAAGVSGGGKWSGVIGAILAQKQYNLIGVFMGAVNQDMASEAAKLYEPALRYKRTPIYLSSGTDDKIATPQQHNEVKDSLLNTGFQTVRIETFKGGHALSETDLRKALNWFVEEYSKQ